MDLYGIYERYWCPILLSGALVFLASIVAAPLWR